MDLNVIYEDNHIIVVKKPPMVLSQGDGTGDPDMLSCVKEYIRKKYSKPGNVYAGLVHRLYRPVGGVMVFAKTSKAASRLSEQIRNDGFIKEYCAVIHGEPERQGVFEDWLVRDPLSNNTRRAAKDVPGAKYARLEYKVKRTVEGLSEVRILLLTGRHHQIRVQFASRGFPLFGDVRYGDPLEKGGIALYACRLSFMHPVRKEELSFEADPPWNIEKFIDMSKDRNKRDIR